MNFQKRWKVLGQTTVEYILVVSVSIGLGITMTRKLQAYLLDHPNSLIGGKLKTYQALFNSETERPYKRFYIPR